MSTSSCPPSKKTKEAGNHEHIELPTIAHKDNHSDAFPIYTTVRQYSYLSAHSTEHFGLRNPSPTDASRKRNPHHHRVTRHIPLDEPAARSALRNPIALHTYLSCPPSPPCLNGIPRTTRSQKISRPLLFSRQADRPTNDQHTTNWKQNRSRATKSGGEKRCWYVK